MNDDRIIRKQQYSELLSKCPKEALRIAIENRRFEIELYWKRATYFWTLLAAVFIGFFALQSSESAEGGLSPPTLHFNRDSARLKQLRETA